MQALEARMFRDLIHATGNVVRLKSLNLGANDLVRMYTGLSASLIAPEVVQAAEQRVKNLFLNTMPDIRMSEVALIKLIMFYQAADAMGAREHLRPIGSGAWKLKDAREADIRPMFTLELAATIPRC